jgi:hypothetical protein
MDNPFNKLGKKQQSLERGVGGVNAEPYFIQLLHFCGNAS